MKIIFATGNAHKVREAAEILGGDFEVVSCTNLGITEDIPETGNTLNANSLQKAKYVHDRLGCDCFADDTGLEVDILGGAPGVQTARYAGETKDPGANMDKLLREMALMEHEASMARDQGLRTPNATRKARFKTVVTLILGGKLHFFEGTMEGEIALHRHGKAGFGYDPVFIPDELPEDGTLVPNTERITVADMTEEAKNLISHRGRAVRKMAAYLQGLKK